MIQLLVRKVLVIGLNRWIYPYMTRSNFNIIWSLLRNQIGSLPLRMMISTGLELFNKNRGLSVLTAERILRPLLENTVVAKIQIKESKPDKLVRIVYLLTTTSKLFKICYKGIMWLPKIVLTLTALTFMSIDVTSIFNILSSVTYGFSDLIRIIINTIINIVSLTIHTGEIKDYFGLAWNSLISISDNSINYQTHNIVTDPSQIPEGWNNRKVWSAVGLIVFTWIINKISETAFMEQFLEDHKLISKFVGFFKGVYKLGSELNIVLKDNVPLIGKIESLTYSIGALAISTVFTIGNYTIVKPVKGVYTLGYEIINLTILKPIGWIKNIFTDSEVHNDLQNLKRDSSSMRREIEELRAKRKPKKPEIKTNEGGSWFGGWGSRGTTPSSASATKISKALGELPTSGVDWSKNTSPINLAAEYASITEVNGASTSKSELPIIQITSPTSAGGSSPRSYELIENKWDNSTPKAVKSNLITEEETPEPKI